MTELNKTFDPTDIEARWYAHWEATGAFRPHRPDAVPYTIVMPPPNVTGSLHIGHALDNTLQDILIRYERLRGKDALWVAGTDHAGIATQMVVERQMAAAQDKRTNYSREDFIQKVWDWKAESGGQITQQLRRLGASCDWANERFTMDEGFSKAVTKVFVDLYNEGLIYRDKRLVNWDPGLKTAISDLEVETREINGKFWHFRYPLADGATYTYTARDAEGQVTLEETRDYIVVATTRPETMLADMAVAVHPEDARYAALVAAKAHVVLPITGRRIPIIADEHADPALGSGAVKITPGHDFNDFEVGKRAGIAPGDMLNMLDADGRVVQVADERVPQAYLGLYRFGIEGEPTNARKMVVEAITAAGLLDKIEERTIQTPFGDRSGVVIEPWLTDQWYVDAKTLAQPAIEAVRSGAIKIVPETWEKTWFQWLENIQPWCVSRQLWWGHRIPVWYGPLADESGVKVSLPTKTFAAETEAEVIRQAKACYGAAVEISLIESDSSLVLIADVGDDPTHVTIYRDRDVLDTWFSSALWPFGTLGWPDADQPSPLPLAGGVGGGQPTDEVEPTPNPSRKREGDGTRAPLSSAGASMRPRLSPTLSPKGEREITPPSLLARHYPNDVLISGFDILFFWDARMAMQGLHFMGQAPWKTLYLHGLVRAADGSKMSKSKGNTVDPLLLIDKYGADALRFFMAAMESQGRDIKMDERRLEGYRNFATKLWNAARFAQANGIGASASPQPPAAHLAVNKWIIGEVAKTVGALDAALADLRFDAAANAVYHFVWDTFCDWYLELIKAELQKPSPLQRRGLGEGSPGEALGASQNPSPNPSPEGEGDTMAETRAVAGWVLDQILVMLHPFMPFITEELWHALADPAHPRTGDLIHADWVKPEAAVDDDAQADLNWIIAFIKELRSAKNELGISPAARLSAHTVGVSVNIFELCEQQFGVLSRLARLDAISTDPPPPGASMTIVVYGETFIIPLEGILDLDAERARLTKAIEAASKEANALAARIGNSAFVEKAKPEAVEKARADYAEKAAEAERLAAALARLG